MWEAMRWAKARGCTEFDLGGYSLSARRGEPLWHVNVFKQGFAPGQPPQRTVAVHERVFSPLIVSSAAAVRRWQTRRRLGHESGRPNR
jgi:lipid II:glycine glycyltransferase (peptidoglycan interpeptide bridge formation enzyme)